MKERRRLNAGHMKVNVGAMEGRGGWALIMHKWEAVLKRTLQHLLHIYVSKKGMTCNPVI